MLGAEPYLAGNVGSGSPQELCDWVEYCNTSVNTSLARERAANGSPVPFNVRRWGVGNENWGCGGTMDAAIYAHEHRRYAIMLRHVDPQAELVACGHDDAWNETFLATVGKHLNVIDHLSILCYWRTGGPETDFDEAEYYRLLAEARATEECVARTARLIDNVTGGTHRIGIALDEWGVWYPEARPWGPGDIERRTSVTYEQANTLRDALAAALTLANLAQIVNVLQAVVMTDGDRI
jgi:alpha-N-arabinofuranosidase